VLQAKFYTTAYFGVVKIKSIIAFSLTFPKY